MNVTKLEISTYKNVPLVENWILCPEFKFIEKIVRLSISS